jgi:uncharacterized membrane protein
MTEMAAGGARAYRLSNIDFLRGLVIVIMAIDHVRDYFLMGTVLDPLSQPDVPASLYLTRWVTHFCAPVFIFLAGTSAGLMAARKSPTELSGFLLKRGLWIIFVEAAINSTASTFSPLGIAQLGGATLLIFQVLWAIGASMVLLAVAQFLGRRACLIIGAAILLSYNLLDPLWPEPNVMRPEDTPIWTWLFYQTSLTVGPIRIALVYPLLAWFGVMMLGFGSAFIFEKSAAERDSLLLKIGLAFTAAFVLLRASGLYGDSNPWQVHDGHTLATFFDFMNVTKYPPSLLFLLATLGPMAILCAFADRFSGVVKDILVMFGRVPFAFYVTHIALIHLLAVVYGVLQGFEASQLTTLFFFFPPDYGTSLTGVYLVWLLVLALLYPLCRWMAEVKSRRKDWWLSYL